MKIFFCIIFSFASLLSFGQSISNEVISSNGNYYKNANIAVSWTIGEAFIESYSKSSVILTQGFHQPILIESDSNPGGILIDKNITISIFPNPTFNSINISIINFEKYSKALLYDGLGKIITETTIAQQLTEINMKPFSEGIYYLKVLDNQNQIQSFKIEKFN